MGTSRTFSQKLAFMKVLLKRKDLDGKAAVLKEFCLIQECTMACARDVYNIVI